MGGVLLRLRIVSLATVVTLGFVLTGYSASAAECTHAERTSGQCPSVSGLVSQQGVTLSGSLLTPGSPGSTVGASGGSWVPPPPRDPVLGSAGCPIKIAGKCQGSSPAKNPEPTRPTPPGSISDIAEFAPGAPSFVIEPNGWTLPLLPTNFYSMAQDFTETGELLGWPIEVRFTPVSYRWDYGDGTARTLGRPGSSWEQNQFASTTSSHAYQRSGIYRVSLEVVCRASYRFGDGPFISVPGTLTRDAGSQSVDVLTVSSVLVDRGCFVDQLVLGRC